MKRSSGDLAPRIDGVEQVAHRRLAESFHLLQMDFPLLRSSSVKMSAGSLDPALRVEKFDLFFASPSMSKARRETKWRRCSIS